jgi:hypothetical protein
MVYISRFLAAMSFRRYKLLCGAGILLASSATVGHATSIYPQRIDTSPTQSADVVRPCTGLEKAAQLSAQECGTLTLSAVVTRLNALERDDHDE